MRYLHANANVALSLLGEDGIERIVLLLPTL